MRLVFGIDGPINGGDPERGLAVREELIWYQLVGEVTAYQG